MGQTITAIYEHGILRLLEPLPYPEHTQVELAVQRVTPAPDADMQRARVRHALTAAGLLVLPAADTAYPVLDAVERARLARALADTGVPPLSAAIQDDREGR